MFFPGLTRTKKATRNSAVRVTTQWAKRHMLLLALLLMAGLSAGLFQALRSIVPSSQILSQDSRSYIISAKDYPLLQLKIKQMAVTPSHELALINALAVDLSEQQLLRLSSQMDVNVTDNHQVELSGGMGNGNKKWRPESVVPAAISADAVHSGGNYGAGVTIAFLDTGLDQLPGIAKDLNGWDKVWGTYDAINNTVSNQDHETNGHGTHVASIAGNSAADGSGKIYGVAPNALLMGIRAFGEQGQATYADVIRGIDWAVLNQNQYNIRVLNMSFSGPVRSNYWQDPLNQAVMKAWQAGIVVVASASNQGPNPMTIGVPGNLPYIITVGATTDNYTPTDTLDDRIASFSSSGPTVEGFVKPEIVAPGGHLSGLMASDSYLANQHPDFHDGGRYFEMSGTSQATAVVSGVVALMLSNNPALTPDEVKCRLVSSAHPAMTADNKLAYSVFQQGAGVVNANDAVNSTASGCANQGMDIAKDLADIEHYYGPADINSDGDLYVKGLGAEYIWDIPTDLKSDGGLIWGTSIFTNSGYSWPSNVLTDGGLIWGTSFNTSGDVSVNVDFVSNTDFLWRESRMVDSNYSTNTSASIMSTQGIGVNNWVEQQ
ncbi:MAG: serine protease AprX [Phenylobacterium sp.]|jgi:serine protease AprX